MYALGLLWTLLVQDIATELQPLLSGSAQPHLSEIRRLLRRKSELLATGAYERNDPLIQRIDDRVAQLAGLPPGALSQT